jgi:OOP family OmpA-OmpF porin
MNKHLLTLISAILLLSPSSFSQSYDKKFGVEINGGIREYHGDMGSALYFQRRPDYQAAGVAFGMYVNPSFDANLYGSVGDLGFYNQNVYDEVRMESFAQGFTARISTVMLGLTYKFNNGYILAEDARIKPFVRGGWGASQSVSLITNNFLRYNNYSRSRSWVAAHWNLALGAKIRLTNSIDFVISEEFNYSFDDNYDGVPFVVAGAQLNTASVEGNNPLHDAFMYHNVGFAFNFGSTGNSGYKIKDSDNDGISDKFDLCPKTPEGYEVDTVGCPLDDDNDGVINEEDKCPKTPGTVENNGCPETDEGKRESGIKEEE